ASLAQGSQRRSRRAGRGPAGSRPGNSFRQADLLRASSGRPPFRRSSLRGPTSPAGTARSASRGPTLVVLAAGAAGGPVTRDHRIPWGADLQRIQSGRISLPIGTDVRAAELGGPAYRAGPARCEPTRPAP